MIGLAHIALLLAIIAISIYGILNAKANQKLYTTSLILTVLMMIKPINDRSSETMTTYDFGFPGIILDYHSGLDFNFHPLAYLFKGEI